MTVVKGGEPGLFGRELGPLGSALTPTVVIGLVGPPGVALDPPPAGNVT